MAIKAECPLCHRKQAVKNKICKCGQDMDNAKGAKKVKFHITYRLPGNGKQRQEFVGYSITEARTAEGKRMTQKWENPRILQKVPEEKMTFRELTDWYLDLQSVKNLKDYSNVSIRLNNFNEVLGERIVGSIKPTDVEDYQHIRKANGIASTTIDGELTHIKTVITKAFDNDLVSGHTLKVFKKWKKLARKDERVRDRTLTLEEYLALVAGSPVEHLRNVLVIGIHTGMRPGEIKALRWSHVDLKGGFIRLPADTVKEGRAKAIPINHHVDKLLRGLPTRFAGGPVLTYAGRPLGEFKTSLRTACKNAGILYGRKVEGGFILHDLRRTFKTNMLRAKVDKVYRDTIVGHSLKGMDAHYLVPSEEDLTEAMEKHTVWFDSEISTVDHLVDQKNSNS
jgi:integrase